MKRKLKKLGWMITLMLHSFVVVCIPVTSWIVAVAINKGWMYVVATALYFFVQVPIAIYAITKDNSIFDKIIDHIKEN